tara:strand:- start:3562 stop:4053 length:492 start_codon:yes stop_codon:yes gene_type:complete
MTEEPIEQDLLDKAYDLYFSDDYDDLEILLRPFICSYNVHIKYLQSYCTHDDGNRILSSEEADKEWVEFLHECAENEVADAMYHLAIHYWNGEDVEKNEAKAAEFFEKAAKLGHGASILAHGKNLYYGLFGLDRDLENGLDFMKKAVDIGVESAEYEYAKANQ